MAEDDVVQAIVNDLKLHRAIADVITDYLNDHRWDEKANLVVMATLMGILSEGMVGTLKPEGWRDMLRQLHQLCEHKRQHGAADFETTRPN